MEIFLFLFAQNAPGESVEVRDRTLCGASPVECDQAVDPRDMDDVRPNIKKEGEWEYSHGLLLGCQMLRSKCPIVQRVVV